MDSTGCVGDGLAYNITHHYAPFMEEMECGIVEQPIPKSEPAPQSASLQEPQIYGSGIIDVFD